MTKLQMGLTHFITCNGGLNMKLETKTDCPLTPLIMTSDFQVSLLNVSNLGGIDYSPEVVRPFSSPFSRFRVQTDLKEIYYFVKLFSIFII